MLQLWLFCRLGLLRSTPPPSPPSLSPPPPLLASCGCRCCVAFAVAHAAAMIAYLPQDPTNQVRFVTPLGRQKEISDSNGQGFASWKDTIESLLLSDPPRNLPGVLSWPQWGTFLPLPALLQMYEGILSQVLHLTTPLNGIFFKLCSCSLVPAVVVSCRYSEVLTTWSGRYGSPYSSISGEVKRW